jgi:1,2-dihydroxy-3-keto-5-methylthiopentene dioxygenase
MSRLTIYPEDAPGAPSLRTEDKAVIADSLRPLGVRFEHWGVPADLDPDGDADVILTTFRPHLDALIGGTAGTADVIRMDGAAEAYPAMRAKFIEEHTHTEDEVRFFVKGSGNFILHLNGQVYDVHCDEGDLISVPAGTKHWFDGGPSPCCTVLRVFTDTTGWTPHYTGSPISAAFPAA